jgi:hypothetical protein
MSVRGSPVTCGIVVGEDLITVKKELKKWRGLMLPQSLDTVQLIAELEGEKIGIHLAVPGVDHTSGSIDG